MRLIAYFFAAAVLLAGCGSEDPREPKGHSTPSATPAATPPTMPAQARENTPAGAIAFVKHYIDVFNYASNTGDVADLQKLSDPECDGCNSYIRLYKGTYAAGGYYRDSDWKLSEFEVRTGNKHLLVLARLTAQGGTYKSAANDHLHNGNPEDTRLAFLPRRGPDGWKLYTLERPAQ